MATRDIGLVLDGGGGKGAYQLGVWKALRETGLDQRIAQISGASVGGLNAALMVQGDYDLAERIWFEEIKTLKPTRIHMWVEGIIKEHLDFSAFSKSEITCWLATTCISPIIGNIECLESNGRKLCKENAHYFNMNILNEVNCRKLLTENVLSRAVMLATCALPLICTSKRIDGLWYLDGGLVDNSPVTPIFDVPRYSDNIPKCDKIIIIHLDPVRNDHDPEARKGTHILQITPSKELGGFLDGTINFDSDHARMLANWGYSDSLPLFLQLLENEKKITAQERIEGTKNAIQESIRAQYIDILETISKTLPELDKELPLQSDSEYYEEQMIADLSNFSIQQMKPAEKYMLSTEIHFILAQNQSKINYLDVSFFPMLWQIITGKRRKGKMQIIKNSQRIQSKLNSIVSQLDNEIQQLKIDHLQLMQKEQISFRLSVDDGLLLVDIIRRNDLKYNEDLYNKVLNGIETARRLMLNNLNTVITSQETFTFCILRLIPGEIAFITEKGPEIEKLPPEKYSEVWKHLISPDGFFRAQRRGPYQAIILPHGVHLAGIQTDRIISFNEYQMMHYIHIKVPTTGTYVVMIDYYNKVSYLSGYLVGENGSFDTIFDNASVERGYAAYKYKEVAEEEYKKRSYQPSQIQFAKCYIVDAHIEKNYERIGCDTFSLDENWLYQDRTALNRLLNPPDILMMK